MICDFVEKLRTAVPRDLPGLLGELDDAGFFLAPDESVTQLTERLSALADGLSLLPEEPLLTKLTADAAEVSSTLRDRAYELTSQKFRFRMKWIPVWYSSRQTGIFSAGVLLEIDRILPLVFLNNGFSGKGKYMGYDAAETLAHEMIHAARIAFPASAYEEYFSCNVNRSAFRRAVGNLFRRWYLPLLFFGGLTIAAFLLAAGWHFWFALLLPSVLLFIREIILHRRIRAAGEKLHRAGLDEALLLRLSDSEIFALSRSKLEEIMLKKNESLRWAMLLEKFRSEKG
ncbi:hypothetical protein FYJ85_21730 [Victivallaceae bacterium BBE-744-WT-12]|uniref:Uncharacterized protein n=1 Tax=Victivallis lenta TaxID=2606640 RepID=A0A844G9N6_9BACT|nr:hypothetical protein [Victivallis lenta]MST99654.1 hypothetical protein [Victivallis lenta]